MPRGRIRTSSPVNWRHPLNQGRVAWWLCVPWLWGGTQLYDLCGLYHGTLNNFSTGYGWQATTRPGGWGQLSCDGVSDYVATPISMANLPSSGTIAFWANPSRAYNSGIREFLWGIDNSGSPEFHFQIYNNTYYVGWNSSGHDTRVVVTRSSANWLQNIWQLFTFTWISGGTSALYNNTSLLGTKAGTVVGSNTPVFWIGNADTGPNPYQGRFDDFGLWNRPLSVSEIAALYDQSLRGYPDMLNRWDDAAVWTAGSAPPSTPIFRRTLYRRAGSRGVA